MRKLLRTISAAAVSSMVLTGCEVGPDYKPPELDMPKLSDREEMSIFKSRQWWSVFSIKTLNKLEEQALKHNADLKIAIANIDAAKAAAGIAQGDLLPQIAASGEGGKAYISSKGKNYMPGLTTKRNSTDYLGAVGMSYELDFFGKYRRANEAARAQLLATRAAKDAVLLSITAQVAKNYFLIRALDAKLAIARRTLSTRQQTYNVYKSRFRSGYCTELDYLRIESEMASVKTTVLGLEEALAKAETSMSVLLGCSPRLFMDRKTSPEKAIERLKIPNKVPKGIPSDILNRRPDLLQAEGVLIAANAKIGEAKAAFFPSISLTGALGVESKTLGKLFSPGSDMWNFSGGINLPIFTGGKLSSMSDAAQANYRAALAAYEKTVQVAFKETLDALVSNRKSREIVKSRTRQVNALKRSYDIAKKQKDAGLIGLIDLLDVERGLLACEMELTTALQDQLNAVVDLCKALGGGWKRL
ncbi:MAG: efflux transporter outer membrane subunit [Alphaproteobacteria bacterium]|nr:efflux transporter outer membrane subunit [Alphaproteobacteria bacterium]